MKRSVMLLCAYIRALQISAFALPVEDSRGLHVAIVNPAQVVDAVTNDAPTVERHPKELYARVKRIYTATKVCPVWKPIALLDTPYKRLADIPKHAHMKARGFELVVRDALNATGDSAVHVGDKANSVDVISLLYGNIECKVGGGRLYYAGGNPPRRKGGTKK